MYEFRLFIRPPDLFRALTRPNPSQLVRMVVELTVASRVIGTGLRRGAYGL